MSTKETTFELFDSYAGEVAVYLPRKIRSDVEIEIRSLLEDALEDRCQAEGQEPDEAMVMDVLKEFGPPSDMAASYKPVNYLVGPRFFSLFFIIMQITLAFMVLILVTSFITTIIQRTPLTPLEFFETISGLIPAFLLSFFQSLGITVLIFAILERTLPPADPDAQLKAWVKLDRLNFVKMLITGKRDPESKTQEWDPQSLQAIQPEDRVSRAEMMWRIVFFAGLLILFNFFPHKIGAFNVTNDKVWFIPLLSPDFVRYFLPWVSLYWGLRLAFHIFLLQQGQWKTYSRWIRFGLGVLGWLILRTLTTATSLIGINPDYLAGQELTPTMLSFAQDKIVPNLNVALHWIFIINLVFVGLALVRRFFSLIRVPPVVLAARNSKEE